MLGRLHSLGLGIRMSNRCRAHFASQALPEQQADRQQQQQQATVAADDNPPVDPIQLQLEKQLLQKATAGKGFSLRYAVPWDIW
jgi:hypothetical protein